MKGTVEIALSSIDSRTSRALIIGHLSTVGDIEVLDWVTAQLAKLGVRCDVCAYSWSLRFANPRWVDGRTVDPSLYSHLIVVCGPFDPSLFKHEIDLFARFSHCNWVGLNLSMIAPIERFNPFDALLERDSDRLVRPDLSLARKLDRVPVIGVCFAGRQPEYGLNQMHDVAQRKLLALVERNSVAVIELDTKWPAGRNKNGLRSPAEFESLCARLDVLLTTRLHGMVLALKNGVPVIAVDAIRGGGKVLQQARILAWSEAFAADAVSDEELSAALDRCFAPEARDRASACARTAREALAALQTDFAAAMRAHVGVRSLPSNTHLRLKRLWTLLRERKKRFRDGGLRPRG